MVDNIAQNKYSNVVDSYTALNVSSNIRGELIEKNDKNIKIDIGNSKALEIELREDVEIKKGETVLIDRRNIVKSKVINLENELKVENGDLESYSDVLESLDIAINEENIKVMKRLDNYGIDMTKENFETYRLAKNSLEEISVSLDYESAIRLIEKDVDVENESIQKLSELISELEEEKEGFNILNMFKKKELTTEDAEEIAKEIYGNKMGKDIIDIIKSLHKKKVNITKKNIEKINDVFYKLDNLKDIEDKTFINTIKNKLDINIDNLYKVKRYVKDENIVEEVSLEAKLVDTNRAIRIKDYEVPSQDKIKITNGELVRLEEDIKDLMINLELEPSKENIKLSKEFIKRNMDVTKENITSIDDMKKALEVIIKNLDRETAAQLVKNNVDIETMDIREVAEKIELFKNPERVMIPSVSPEVKLEDQDIQLTQAEKPVIIDEIRTLKENIIKSIETVEEKISVGEKVPNLLPEVELQNETPLVKEILNVEEIKELKQEVAKEIDNVEKKVYESIKLENQEVQITEETTVKQDLPTQEIMNQEQENINKIMKKVESLEKVSEQDILTLLEKNVDFKINKIEQVIFGKRETVVMKWN